MAQWCSALAQRSFAACLCHRPSRDTAFLDCLVGKSASKPQQPMPRLDDSGKPEDAIKCLIEGSFTLYPFGCKSSLGRKNINYMMHPSGVPRNRSIGRVRGCAQ